MLLLYDGQISKTPHRKISWSLPRAHTDCLKLWFWFSIGMLGWYVNSFVWFKNLCHSWCCWFHASIDLFITNVSSNLPYDQPVKHSITICHTNFSNFQALAIKRLSPNGSTFLHCCFLEFQPLSCCFIFIADS